MFILSFTGLGCTVNPFLNSVSSIETDPDKFILSIKKSLPPPLTNLNLNLKLLTKKLVNEFGPMVMDFQSDPVGIIPALVLGIVEIIEEEIFFLINQVSPQSLLA